jgi:hypothetical protein
MTPDTMTEIEHLHFYVPVVRVPGMRLPRTVTPLARECLVPALQYFLVFVGMAFFTGLLPRVCTIVCRDFHQCIAAIPTVVVEGGRGEEVTRHEVTAYNANSQQ